MAAIIILFLKIAILTLLPALSQVLSPGFCMRKQQILTNSL